MPEKTTVNIGFGKQLWDAVCVMRGHISATEYRQVIIGLIFLRYISVAFDRKHKKLVDKGEGNENEEGAYKAEGVFYVPEAARWGTIAAAAHSPRIGMVLDEAMRTIEERNASLRGVLPKIYAGLKIDKTVLGDAVDVFTNSTDMDRMSDCEDVLGRTYEYCLAQFAEYEGRRGGEYYTPASIVRTLVEVLQPFENCRVYDPCCGSGGMFVQSAKFIRAHAGRHGAISIYGQEANSDTWGMARINLAVRGLGADLGEHPADTFTDDLHRDLRADFILANPPFNYSPWKQGKLLDDPRWQFGIPPASNANFAWIQHMIYHLAPFGRIGLVLANGALTSQFGGENAIRQRIIEADLIEGIIAMPPQLFYNVTIPVALWFISKDKRQKRKTLFIDARDMGHMVDRKHREFSDEDIHKLASTFDAFRNGSLHDVRGFCAVVATESIAQQGFVLTPGRYVGIEDARADTETFDAKMLRLTSELTELFDKSHELEAAMRDKLSAIGYDM